MNEDVSSRYGYRPDMIADLSLLRLSPEQHAERARGIGGSDATIIMSGKPADIVALWEIKTGRRAPDRGRDEFHILLGVWTEPLILAWAERELFGVTMRGRGMSVVHPRRPHMRFTQDACMDYQGQHWVVQAKHVNAFSSIETVYNRYRWQCLHEALCAEAEGTMLVVCVGTSAPKAYPVSADDIEAASLLMEAEDKFWWHVQKDEPPYDLRPEVPVGKVPPPVRTGEVSMEGNNAWAAHAAAWLANRDAARAWEESAKALKEAMPKDAKRAYGHGVEVVAARNGALSIKAMEDENGKHDG